MKTQKNIISNLPLFSLPKKQWGIFSCLQKGLPTLSSAALVCVVVVATTAI